MMAGLAALRSRKLDLPGGTRHLVEWGEPDAPVVLLLHGMRDHAQSWTWIAELLAPHRRVVAPDLRGHGDSSWSADGDYTLTSYVRDLAELVDALELAQFDLVGHSLGGQIALRFAASFPDRVRSQVLIEGVELPLIRQERQEHVPYPARVREWIDGSTRWRNATPRHYPDLESALRRMCEAHRAIDRDTLAFLTRTGVIEEPGRGFRWKYDNACRFRPPEDQHGCDLDEMLEAIACPTLLAYGDDSWIPPPPAERLARLRDHRVIRFAGASHWLHHQRRSDFCALLDRFLPDPIQFLQSESLIHA